MAKNEITTVMAVLDGKVVTTPELISETGGTQIYTVTVEVKRRSGVVDSIQVQYRGEDSLEVGSYYHIEGDIRTLNVKNTDMVIADYFYAMNITKLDNEPEEYINEVHIRKAEFYQFYDSRKSYDDTTDVTMYRIKLNRRHNRCSYFRVTSWGGSARFIAKNKDNFDLVDLNARMQSYVLKNGTLCISLAAYKFRGSDEEDREID